MTIVPILTTTRIHLSFEGRRMYVLNLGVKGLICRCLVRIQGNLERRRQNKAFITKRAFLEPLRGREKLESSHF